MALYYHVLIHVIYSYMFYKRLFIADLNDGYFLL